MNNLMHVIFAVSSLVFYTVLSVLAFTYGGHVTKIIVLAALFLAATSQYVAQGFTIQGNRNALNISEGVAIVAMVLAVGAIATFAFGV